MGKESVNGHDKHYEVFYEEAHRSGTPDEVADAAVLWHKVTRYDLAGDPRVASYGMETAWGCCQSAIAQLPGRDTLRFLDLVKRAEALRTSEPSR